MYAILVVLQSIIALFLGISELLYVNKYSHFDIECYNINNWLKGAAIINIIIPLVTCFGIRSCDRNECGAQFLQISQLIIATWAVITYHLIDTSCYIILITFAPEFWTFILIHYVIFWIIICIIILCGIVYLSRNDIDYKNHESIPNDDINVQIENTG